MIAYITVGADDIARAKRFYSAFLPALGYQLKEGPAGLSFSLPVKPGHPPCSRTFTLNPLSMVARPRPATALWPRSRRAAKSRCAIFTPPRFSQAVPARVSRAFATITDRTSTPAIFATPKATRSHFSPAIRMSLGATDSGDIAADNSHPPLCGRLEQTALTARRSPRGLSVGPERAHPELSGH